MRRLPGAVAGAGPVTCILLGALGGPAGAAEPAVAVEPTVAPAPVPAAPREEAVTLAPTVRIALGPSWMRSPRASEPGLALDVDLGAALGWTGSGAARLFANTLWLRPEFGYGLRYSSDTPQLTGHLATAGLGLGFGNLLFASVAYTPRLVVGVVGGLGSREVALGLRHGISGSFLASLFYAELSHQMLTCAGQTTHELRFVVGMNAGVLLLRRLLE